MATSSSCLKRFPQKNTQEFFVVTDKSYLNFKKVTHFYVQLLKGELNYSKPMIKWFCT